MSCPRTHEVERKLSSSELRSFCDHAKQCADCGKLLDRVADAYQLLREDVVPISPSRRVELLARIEAEVEKPRFELRWMTPLAIAAAAAVAIATWPKDAPDAPQLLRGTATVGDVHLAAGEYVAAKARAVAEADTRVEFRGHLFDVEEKSALSFEPGPNLVAMKLDDGRVRFELAPLAGPDVFTVSTSLARFEVMATRFTIDVEEDRVEVAVDAGRVRVIPIDDGAPRIVSAGEVAIIEREKPELAAAPPPVEKSEPKQEEAPPPPPEKRPKPRAIGKGGAQRPSRMEGPPGDRTSHEGGAERAERGARPERDPKIEKRLEPAVEQQPIAEQKPIAEQNPVAEQKPPEERLDEARSIVTTDAAKARDLAQGVLQEKPAPELEIGALLVLADAYRRTGEWRQADSAYQKVADHPRGAPYAEEALLRRAQLLGAHRRENGALAVLAEAWRRFPGGTLAPERAVLEARLHLAGSDPMSAAAAIERAGGDRTLAVLRQRVEVAEALVASSPERARAIAAPVLEANVSADLSARAKMIVSGPGGNR